METERPLLKIFLSLLSSYGPQSWWPAETPFEVMAGAVLTQNTSWGNVERAVDALKAAAPMTATGILSLAVEDLEAAVRPSGYFRQKARRLRILSRWVVDRLGGVPGGADGRPTMELRRELLALEGVGPETADSILLYAFKRPVFVVDAYTVRLLDRLGLLPGKGTYHEVQEYFHGALPADSGLFNEYHALIVRHGKERCRKRAPVCEGCPLVDSCGWESKIQGPRSRKKR